MFSGRSWTPTRGGPRWVLEQEAAKISAQLANPRPNSTTQAVGPSASPADLARVAAAGLNGHDFPPTPEEKAELVEKTVQGVQLVCGWGMVGFLVFGLVDPFMVLKGTNPPFVPLRAAEISVLGLLFLASLTRRGKRFALLLGFAASFSAGVTITILTGWTGGPDQVYWATVMLAIFPVALVLPAPPASAGLCFSATAAFYAFWLPVQNATGSIAAWVGSNAAIWTSVAFSTLAVDFLHRSAQRETLSKRRLLWVNQELVEEVESRKAAEETARKAEEKLKAARALAREIGSYRLVRLLGQGGMGQVWLAQHRLLARPAALKCVKATGEDGGTTENDLLRFEQEAQATAGLTSHHTVEIYDYGRADDGSFYYVMELLAGLDLATLVKEHGPQPPARVIKLLWQVCHSLRDAHNSDVLHRDIKPANLMVGKRGGEFDYLKVLDFGLVKRGNYEPGSDGLTAKNHITGTPAYMAPEMIRADHLDGRADLYAVGCVAYWLLAGREVFGHRPPMGHLIAHATEEPQPINEVCDWSLPTPLRDLIMNCLAKDPLDRPADAGVVMRELSCLARAHPWTESDAENWWTARGLRAHPPDEDTLDPLPNTFLRPDTLVRARIDS